MRQDIRDDVSNTLEQRTSTLRGGVLLFSIGLLFGIVAPLARLASLDERSQPFALSFYVNLLASLALLSIAHAVDERHDHLEHEVFTSSRNSRGFRSSVPPNPDVPVTVVEVVAPEVTALTCKRNDRKWPWVLNTSPGMG